MPRCQTERNINKNINKTCANKLVNMLSGKPTDFHEYTQITDNKCEILPAIKNVTKSRKIKKKFNYEMNLFLNELDFSDHLALLIMEK
ncbi:hypothetical protein BpHYR1_028349 [Brachionus plicatilis]|uniref:Uncharacterized protein n=1 Tax=Brachionus plicatilis TaxID=10195 RepID=A0A3M7P5W6_BRAPC|nr:hypothetical protein BpHYR1_028349 [Brachionus plicatilis]